MADAKKTKSAKPAKQAAEQTSATVAGQAEAVVDDAAADIRNFLEAPDVQVSEFLRSIGERSAEQAREAYARMKDAAEDTTDMIEEAFENARDGMLEAQHKAIDIAKDNAAATFEFAKKLLSVTSLADAVELQSGFARDRFEASIDHAKGMQDAANRFAQGVTEPMRTVVSKSLGVHKTA